MIYLRFTFALIFLFGSFLLVQAQPKTITSEQYYGPFRAALSEEKNFARRKTSTTEYFTNGKLVETETWLYEFLPSGDARYLHIETRGEKTFRREQIEVGDQKFCKRDDAEWERTERGCIGGGIGGYSNIMSREYTLEEIDSKEGRVRKFGSRIIYKWPEGNEKEPGIVRFDDSFYLLNGKGLITRRESKAGIVETKEITKKQVEIYEYDPNIKIEAPIP